MVETVPLESGGEGWEDALRLIVRRFDREPAICGGVQHPCNF